MSKGFKVTVEDLDNGETESRVVGDDERGRGVYDPISGWRYDVPKEAVVKVLERADDPSTDPIGTVRREQHAEDATDQGYSVWQHTQYQVASSKAGSHWLCTHSTHFGNLGEALTHDQVRGMPVIGAAPGTPAAEAQTPVPEWDQPGPRRQVRVENAPGLPLPVRQQAADRLVAGDVPGAVAAVVSGGFTRDQADRYVRDMPEWQTYLNHHGSKADDETRTLLVHPHAWKPVVSYLDGIAVEVFEVSGPDDERQTYAMKPSDGAWPS